MSGLHYVAKRFRETREINSYNTQDLRVAKKFYYKHFSALSETNPVHTFLDARDIVFDNQAPL